MKTFHGLIAVATLVFAVGCASKDVTEEQGAAPTLTARLKAGTLTFTATETSTSTHTSSSTGSATQVVTLTQTTTNTVTNTSSSTATASLTLTATSTATATQTGTITHTSTQTATATGTRTASAPGTYQQVYTFTGTVTATATAIAYYTSWPHSQGNTSTTTTTSYSNGTGANTVTRTVTSPFNSTETNTASGTITGVGTRTGTTTVAMTASVTSSTTNAGTGTGSVTETGTGTGTASQTWTATWTTQVTQTTTNTTTFTVTVPQTVTNTLTVVNTSTLSQTQTQTLTTSGTSTSSSTSTTTGSGTTTVTTTDTTTETVTQTVTLTGSDTDTGTGTGTGGCLLNWRATTCGQWCTHETQDDRRQCAEFLKCYSDHAVGPSDDPDGTCGVNKFSAGMAPKTIADQVYQCLGCPGTSPVSSCAGIPNTAPCAGNSSCTTGNVCKAGECVCSNGNQAPDPTKDLLPYPGTLTGDLSVSSSGAAMYKVPIALPPGIAGMAPNLALVYSSQGGNGIAGQGWDLTGLSMIHRCAKTRPEDGYARPVTLSDPLVGDGSDGICLDGKRLFDRGQMADGSGERFEPELTDFSDITMATDGSIFTVVTKSGETRYYGLTDKARVRVPSSSPNPQGDGKTTGIWLLEKVVDVWGNYYDIEYNSGNKDFETSGITVSAIAYTGRLAGSLADENADPIPTFELVRFNYELRPDIRTARLRSATFPRILRLKRIITGIGSYTLGYGRPPGATTTDDKMLPSLLQTINYCPGTEGCSHPLTLSFDWDGGGYGWQEMSSNFKLPDTLTPGTWFMDLDGDGRLDVVSSATESYSKAWRNTGVLQSQTGFQLAPGNWSLPSDAWSAGEEDTSPGNTAFADLDGDGLLDVVHLGTGNIAGARYIFLNRIRREGDWSFRSWPSGGPAWVDATKINGDRGALIDMDGDGLADLVSMGWGKNEPMRVLINTGFDETTTPPSAKEWVDASSNYGGITPISDYELRDVNRDGIPDLVGKAGTSGHNKTYLNAGKIPAGQSTVWVRYDVGSALDNVPPDMKATADFDGDGLYDVIAFGCKTGAGYHGLPNVPYCELWRSDEIPAPGSGVPNPYPTELNFLETMALSTGLEYTTLPSSNPRMTVLDGFTPPRTTGGQPGLLKMEEYAFIPVDLNGDGLADLVQRILPQLSFDNDPIGAPGRVFFNTGKTFIDLDGATSWTTGAGSVPPIPRVPLANRAPNRGDRDTAFVDLDGDGVTDVASTTKSWRNTFRPPVIKGFPNGLARKSVPTYQVITTAAAQMSNLQRTLYSDSAWEGNAPASGTTPMITPLRVVASLAVDDGVGGSATTDYQYRNLRASPSGRGPQGFGTVIATGPEDRSLPANRRTRIETTTDYAQRFPYTGMAFKVKRALVSSSTGSQLRVLSVSTTDYCDTIPGDGQTCTPIVTGDDQTATLGRTRFVRPEGINDTSFLISSSSLSSSQGIDEPVTVTTHFTYDGKGNPRETGVSTTQGAETYRKTITNVYGIAGSQEERLGKVTSSTVVTEKVTPVDCLATPIGHTTLYQYGQVSQFESPVKSGEMVGTLGLKKTIVEPDAGAPIELHTTYEYDRFGNVIKTTSCADEFDSCGQAGATGSGTLPYRITQVSFDPVDFAVPSGTGHLTSLSYGPGRFPVKTTNAAGHIEMTAYDARFGTLVQQTGPNGISTCKDYDSLGRQISETARCGSSGELTTTIQRFLRTSNSVVTVTKPPTGSPTWVYGDSLGRTVMTLSRAFDDRYVKTLTTYNNLGRVVWTTKPYLSTSTIMLSEVGTRAISTAYDPIGRVSTVTQDLGVLDGTSTGGPGSGLHSTTVTTTYEGTTVTTTRTVNGETRTRSETKNGLGKVASVTDARGVTISFAYDADGNLRYTASPEDACAPASGAAHNAVQITYDSRGRKQSTHDPDLGDWEYHYDSFGDLVLQTDGKGRPTNMTYDILGRMVQRSDDSGNARWIYDVAPHGIGKLAAMVSPSDPRLGGACQLEYAPVPPTGEKQAGRSYHYTEFGDVEQVTDCADGSSFVTNYGYDGFGRQKLLYYPTVNGKRLTVSYAYTGTGYLRQVADESTGAALWTAMSMNAAGQVTDEVLGNGVETQSVVNDATGWLLGRTSTAETDGNAVIQEWGYTFDEMGNLRARKRTDAAGVLAASETFGYDAVDRLTGANVQVPAQGYDPQSYVYDDQGNLQSKAGKTYHYGTGCLAGTRTAGPHAVCQIDDGPTYSYDGNGNLKGVGERAVRWNAANKAIRLTSGTGSSTKTADFIYGADGARVVQAVGVGDGELGSSNNSTQSRTVYVGLGATGKSIYERTKHGTITEHSHFIYAGSAHGGSAFAIRVIKQDTSSSATTSKAEYHHFDHLGSVVAATDDSGKVTSAVWSGSSGSVVGYDAWGAVHMPSGQTGGPTTYATPAGNRGFTDQEAIPSLGLVNMNGRIYDPIVGRFLSPDPNVQFASDLQSYNRYSYVTNNPLRYTDPTGYYVYQHSAWKEGLGTFVQMMGALAVVVVCAATDGAGCVPAAAAFSVLTTTAAIATGTPWDRAVAVGAISFALSAVGGSGISAAAKAGEVAWAIGDAAAMGAAISGVYALANGDAFGKGAKSMLEAAAISAATTAFAIAVSRGNPVSQAAAAEQGDGTMEARAGKGTVRAVPRDQTYGTAVKGGPPTAAELAENPRVKAALQVAYDHTNAGVPKLAHEEGGWIYWNPETRDTKVFPGPPGPAGTGSKGYFEIDLTKPKILKDYIVVGTYHAHPLLASEMAGHGGHWPPGPSWADKDVAGQQRVPGLVSDPTGVYLYGVVQRHGIDNGAGFPNWRLGQ